MTKSSLVTPGATINYKGKIFRVESCVKISVPKGTPFIKTKLRDLLTEKVTEKNFKLDQEIQEVSLVEHRLEYLYPEGKEYLFLDINTLEQILVNPKILGDVIHFLKENIEVKALFYGDTIFSVELPQFLELMVVKTDNVDERLQVSSTMKRAVLETGAQLEVPPFVEAGDVIKVDVYAKEYIQRV